MYCIGFPDQLILDKLATQDIISISRKQQCGHEPWFLNFYIGHSNNNIKTNHSNNNNDNK
eukprot:5865425-Amphidinium_carterae.1